MSVDLAHSPRLPLLLEAADDQLPGLVKPGPEGELSVLHLQEVLPHCLTCHLAFRWVRVRAYEEEEEDRGGEWRRSGEGRGREEEEEERGGEEEWGNEMTVQLTSNVDIEPCQ